MRVCFCGAGRARVYVVVSVGVCHLPSCIRVGCKSIGKVLSASLALNAPASLFLIQDRVVPPVIWKTVIGTGSAHQTSSAGRFLTGLGGKAGQKKDATLFSTTCYLGGDEEKQTAHPGPCRASELSISFPLVLN